MLVHGRFEEVSLYVPHMHYHICLHSLGREGNVVEGKWSCSSFPLEISGSTLLGTAVTGHFHRGRLLKIVFIHTRAHTHTVLLRRKIKPCMRIIKTDPGGWCFRKVDHGQLVIFKQISELSETAKSCLKWVM